MCMCVCVFYFKRYQLQALRSVPENSAENVTHVRAEMERTNDVGAESQAGTLVMASHKQVDLELGGRVVLKVVSGSVVWIWVDHFHSTEGPHAFSLHFPSISLIENKTTPPLQA